LALFGGLQVQSLIGDAEAPLAPDRNDNPTALRFRGNN